MPTKQINTNNLQNVSMNKNQDKLEITINASCVWCFKDDQGVFGNPSTLLPNNTYYVNGPTSYGPMTAVNNGTVSFNVAPVGSSCTADKKETGHTITVTGN